MSVNTGRAAQRRTTTRPVRDPSPTEFLNGPGPLDIYPLQNRVSTGHDAETVPRSHYPGLAKQANGKMWNQLNQWVYLWIEEIEADFGLSGSYAQSRTKRQFYPHNIIQPSVKVTATFPSQHAANLFSAFVHTSHHYALRGVELRERVIPARNRPGDSSTLVPTVKFLLNGGNSRFNGSKTSKGNHRPWLLEGYIKTVDAGAERFDYAPTRQFEFTIAESVQSKNIGIWNDEAVQGSTLASWMDIFSQNPLNDFVVPKGGRSGRIPGKKSSTHKPNTAPPLPSDIGQQLKDAFDSLG